MLRLRPSTICLFSSEIRDCGNACRHQDCRRLSGPGFKTCQQPLSEGPELPYRCPPSDASQRHREIHHIPHPSSPDKSDRTPETGRLVSSQGGQGFKTPASTPAQAKKQQPVTVPEELGSPRNRLLAVAPKRFPRSPIHDKNASLVTGGSISQASSTPASPRQNGNDGPAGDDADPSQVVGRVTAALGSIKPSASNNETLYKSDDSNSSGLSGGSEGEAEEQPTTTPTSWKPISFRVYDDSLPASAQIATPDNLPEARHQSWLRSSYTAPIRRHSHLPAGTPSRIMLRRARRRDRSPEGLQISGLVGLYGGLENTDDSVLFEQATRSISD
ncbi:hypothetical protein VTK73DRAFT_1141 [Phialemonium thermophilum]|uniref:Uncharacterized protein n=1 Tax=Phialemonium thermophilum TaxID=223376 RepID=A0ABR3XBU0_9PEZI